MLKKIKVGASNSFIVMYSLLILILFLKPFHSIVMIIRYLFLGYLSLSELKYLLFPIFYYQVVLNFFIFLDWLSFFMKKIMEYLYLISHEMCCKEKQLCFVILQILIFFHYLKTTNLLYYLSIFNQGF